MDDQDRELLKRYIRDDCSPQELRRVKELLQRPQWQQELTDLLQADFETMADEGAPGAALEDWNREFRDKYLKTTPVRKLWRSSWLAYAAACLLILCTGAYFLQKGLGLAGKQQAVAMLVKSNPRGTRSVITLPDSSKVYLGPGSSIRFPEHFAANERAISLSGEAFFEITKDPRHPFLIRTGDIQTKVLGTSFKVTAFRDRAFSVEVATGKVRVDRHIKGSGSLHSLAVLTPGQGILWDKANEKTAAIGTDPATLRAWKNGEITFTSRSVREIAAELENWYNVSIYLDDSQITGRHFSFSVNGTRPVNGALDILCATAHLKYRATGKAAFVISTDNH
ncbi:FecR family protein [Mucilaginibacter gracilis]|uniref:FecR family protein n=1 Tax=Mucilaginibacter gracilis TaxID=423350 RepID=A0A495J375_9SPHI|nr:FecR domain-containing protein [Mucilaginibacter gracilis]RKR83387.1 FecR family protein [Mucilaginibacter gracilis]